ncbi:MAG: triose-phosphate isomerase [Gemmatimonadota bacterium]
MNDDRRPVFAANWKMHMGPEATREYVREFTGAYEARSDRRVVFFPPAISLEAFRDAAAAVERPDLELGAQDVHTATEGAHTSAISAPMVAEAGATWSLAGHSERRREFGDDDAAVAAKTGRILEAGLAPVVCVGETLEERDAGNLRAVLERQVTAVLPGLAPGLRGELTWAYEPVWAIGTGRTAAPSDASEAHAIVREAIAASAGGDVAAMAVILYGGSVKPHNIDELMAATGVDGVLVGGASLDPADFSAICACETGPGR